MRSGAFFIFSHGAYTIFLSGEAKNATFAIGRWEQNLIGLGYTVRSKSSCLAERKKKLASQARESRNFGFRLRVHNYLKDV